MIDQMIKIVFMFVEIIKYHENLPARSRFGEGRSVFYFFTFVRIRSKV